MLRKMMLFACCLLLMMSFACAGEQVLLEYTVTNGAKMVPFLYPASCCIVDDGSLGVFVYLNGAEYVALSIPGRRVSGTEKLRENIGDDSKIRVLTDNMYVFAVHGDENHRRPDADIVCVGLNLPDGTGIIANADCCYGQTGIYDVLLSIVASMADAEPLKVWLDEEWLPEITEKAAQS